MAGIYKQQLDNIKMKVKNTSERAVHLGGGRIINPRQVVEVDAELGDALLKLDLGIEQVTDTKKENDQDENDEEMETNKGKKEASKKTLPKNKDGEKTKEENKEE